MSAIIVCVKYIHIEEAEERDTGNLVRFIIVLLRLHFFGKRKREYIPTRIDAELVLMERLTSVQANYCPTALVASAAML